MALRFPVRRSGGSSSSIAAPTMRDHGKKLPTVSAG
jgi:hypothetical protein